MTGKVFSLAVVLACVAVFSGCNKEYPPVFYQQIYSLDGTRTEAAKPYEKGVPVPVDGFKSNLQIMYEAYPEQVKPHVNSGVYRQGAFFDQHGYIRNMGDGIGDMCDHAAWFVMNVAPVSKRPALAVEIAKAMVEANEEKTLKMLNQICMSVAPDGRVKVLYSYYDQDNFEVVKKREEIFSSSDSQKNGKRLGLTRTYYESGMLATDTYYLYGEPVGYAFAYFEDGGIKTIRFYDKNGAKTLFVSSRQVSEKK